MCDPYGKSENDTAIKSANLSTVGFGVGAVGVALGLYLLVTSGPSSAASRAPAVSTSLSRDGADLTLSGHF